MATEQETEPDKKPRRKRWWLIGCAVVFCLIGLAINGPIARELIQRTLDKQLSNQGLHGNATLSGTLLSGFSFSDFSYSGNKGIQSLQFDRIDIDYSLSELIESKIRSITINNAVAVIDSAKFPQNESSQQDSQDSIFHSLRKIHPWISQPMIEVNKLEFTVLNQGKQQAHIATKSLKHKPNSNDFYINGLTVSDRTGESTPTQDIHLVWRKNSATLDRLEALTDIALEKVTVDWADTPKGNGTLHFLESKLALEINESITLNLSGGSINSQDLKKRFDVNLPATFTLTKADAKILNWKQPLPEWNIDGSLHLASANYEDFQLSDTTITLQQRSHHYQLKTNAQLNSNPVSLSVNGLWTAPKEEQWWAFTEADFTIDTPKLGSLTSLWKKRPDGLDLTKTSIRLSGKGVVQNNRLLHISGNGSVSGALADQTPLPALDLVADYQDQDTAFVSIRSTPKMHGRIDAEARLNLKADTYQGKLSLSEPDPKWINTLANVFGSDLRLTKEIQLTWSGSGSTRDPNFPNQEHQGELVVEKIGVQFPEAQTMFANTEISYHWPHQIDIKTLNLRENDWQAQAVAKWDGEKISAESVQLLHGNEQVASLQGSIPYQSNIRDAQSFFAQKSPWNLTIQSQAIAISKIHTWSGIEQLSQLTGSTKLNTTLSGSPAAPEVTGTLEMIKLAGPNSQELSPLDTKLDFYSKNKELHFESTTTEQQEQRLVAKGTIPFTPSEWLEEPDWITQFKEKSPINADINISKLPLARFGKFIPGIKKIDGSVTGIAHLSGTIEKPIYELNLDAEAPLIRLTSSDVGDIRNIKMNARLDQTQKATTILTAEINGGKFEVSGDIDLTDFSKPSFDLTLVTRYALVHRDDLVSVRANTNLRVLGSMEDATVSGSIGIAESLFYKDIELIPIGVPSSAVATVQLPSISAAKAAQGLPVPEPFSNWKLDLNVRTDDPILIRGNVASGNLTGSLKVLGTLGNPLPKGTILANQVRAKLPFSILNIERGQIIFNGQDGLNPVLKITGKSTVGKHDVTVFVYGSASSPKTTFTSFPPLPESEVMSLLATGTTTSNLENRSVAAFKAFQLFLLKLKQRNNEAGGNRLFKNLLRGVDDLNLNVGEVDPFTGREFASGTIELSPSWHFTAQVDDTQQTRGLIVYVLRFR